MSIRGYIAAKVFCKNCTKGDTKRDAGLTTPEDVERFDNLSYGEHGAFNLLDVYRPKNEAARLPVIVSVHGGGFVYGTKEVYQFYCMNLARKGYAVVNFNYRLAPKCKFPTPIEDTNAVMHWIVSNSEKYGLDTNNVMMVGDSAGAQILCQYATCVTNSTYAKIMELEIPDFKLCAVSLNCGLYDMSRADAKLKVLMEAYLTTHPERYGEKLKYLDYIDGNYPPTYLLSAGGDFLLGNLKPMEEFLKAKKVTVASKVYGDEKTYHVFHVDCRNPLAGIANEDEVSFMKEFINV